MGLLGNLLIALLFGAKHRSYRGARRKRYSVVQRVSHVSQTRRAQVIRDAERRHAGFPSTYAFIRAMSIEAIYARDRGRCALCGRKIQRWAVGGDGPSIDHRKPLARGGAHSPKNVQLAHLHCNQSKGAK